MYKGKSSSLPANINTEIEIDVPEEVAGGKLRFAIVVGMHDGAKSRIPFRVVPYDGKPANGIQVEVLQVEVFKRVIVVMRLRLGAFIA